MSLIYHCSPLTLITISISSISQLSPESLFSSFYLQDGHSGPRYQELSLYFCTNHLSDSVFLTNHLSLICPLSKWFSMMQHKSTFQDAYMIMQPSFSPSMTANAFRMIMQSSPAFSLTSYPLCSSPAGFLSLFIAFAHAFPLSV